MIDAAAQREEIDFVRDVSAPITIAVIAEMLGVPEHDWPLLFRWTNEIIAPEDPEFQRDGDSRRRSTGRASRCSPTSTISPSSAGASRATTS